MAATTKASLAAAATTATVAVLALAAAHAIRSHPQCCTYSANSLEKMERLLSQIPRAPVGAMNVTCCEKERNCLAYSTLLMPDGDCKELGSPCKRGNGERGAVRAVWAEWFRKNRLVGECGPELRCNDTHLEVWLRGRRRCAEAGQLLCACSRQPPSPPPFPDCACGGDDDDDDDDPEGPKLQPAPFGGYECAHTCYDTCSSQRGLPEGVCVFPPLAVHSNAVIHATHETLLPSMETVDNTGQVLSPAPTRAPAKGDPMKRPMRRKGKRHFHPYRSRSFYATPHHFSRNDRQILGRMQFHVQKPNKLLKVQKGNITRVDSKNYKYKYDDDRTFSGGSQFVHRYSPRSSHATP